LNTIDDVKNRIDIVEIIGETVQLRKVGRSHVGFCPFHPNTRTPAFTVYPDSQSFYCFGCQAHGTAFDFVMRKQGLNFAEALEYLANRVGIKLEPRKPVDQQQDQQRQRLIEITTLAARAWNYLLLKNGQAQPAREYLAKRALNAQTIESFQLGFSLNMWDHLCNYLINKKGYTPEEIVAAGLAIQRDDGRIYDRFRGRIIFPIRNNKGEVIGFGGRALGDELPKYLNTPQTLLFEKSNVLYGLDFAREGIRLADAAVVVEGYVDVLTAHQHGFTNVVAPLGTSLTAGHVGLLKKLSQNLFFALDADAAGQKATLRGINAFQETLTQGGAEEGAEGDDHLQATITAQGLVRWGNDFNLRIVRLPAGQDPDEVIKADPQRWRTLLAAAIPVMEFLLESSTTDLNLTLPQDQRTALERLIPLVAQLSGAQQRVYVARLEQVIGLKAELILDLTRASPPKPALKNPVPPNVPLHSPPSLPLPPYRVQPSLPREDYLLALILHYPATEPVVTELLAQDSAEFPFVKQVFGGNIAILWERPQNRLLWQKWQERGETLQEQDLATWAQNLDAPLGAYTEQLLKFQFASPQTHHALQEAQRCTRQLCIVQARQWALRLTQQADDLKGSEASSEIEYAQIMRLLGEIYSYIAALQRAIQQPEA